MRTAFQEQATEYDCGPVVLTNALRYLYSRSNIPADVIQDIYIQSLDRSDGTSNRRIKKIGKWLGQYRHRNFKPRTKYLTGSAVHTLTSDDADESEITKWLRAGGVALLLVTHDRVGRKKHWHYVLGLSYRGGWLNCHDPYPRTSIGSQYQFLKRSDPHGHNLRINQHWLDRETNEGMYHLGTLDKRVCLLIGRG